MWGTAEIVIVPRTEVFMKKGILGWGKEPVGPVLQAPGQGNGIAGREKGHQEPSGIIVLRVWQTIHHGRIMVGVCVAGVVVLDNKVRESKGAKETGVSVGPSLEVTCACIFLLY